MRKRGGGENGEKRVQKGGGRNMKTLPSLAFLLGAGTVLTESSGDWSMPDAE